MGRRRWTGLQERLEASDVGRALISAFVIITLVVIVTLNLPNSKLKQELVRVAEPYLKGIGINQVWSVFAPDPRKSVLRLEARIRFADGSTAVWRPPHGLPFPQSYRDVRWRKWADTAAYRPDYYEPAARWIARLYTDQGRSPVEVALVRRTYTLLPPGSKPSRTDWTEETYYTLDLDAPAARG